MNMKLEQSAFIFPQQEQQEKECDFLCPEKRVKEKKRDKDYPEFTRMGIRLPNDLYDRLKAIPKMKYISTNALIVSLLENWIEETEKSLNDK